MATPAHAAARAPDGSDWGGASVGAQDLGSCFVTVFEVAVRQGAVGDRADYLIFPTNETDHPDYTSITPEKLACVPPARLPPSCAVAWLGRAGGRARRHFFELVVCLLGCRRPSPLLVSVDAHIHPHTRHTRSRTQTCTHAHTFEPEHRNPGKSHYQCLRACVCALCAFCSCRLSVRVVACAPAVCCVCALPHDARPAPIFVLAGSTCSTTFSSRSL
jgi:hypothetical protein